MTRVSEPGGLWLGLCRKPPVICLAPAFLIDQGEPACASRSGSGGPGDRPHRIRNGIGIATGSIRTLLTDRHHLWFGYFTGIVLLFLLLAEAWMATHTGDAAPFLVPGTPGDTFFVLDIRLFFIEMITLTGLVFVLAGLVLHRHAMAEGAPVPISESFARINDHTNPLLGLSIGIAAVATIANLIISESPFFGNLVQTLTMAVFFLPYAYYFPDILLSVVFFSTTLMVVNSILFLVVLVVVPEIVLARKPLLFTLAGSASGILAKWREILGCLLVAGAAVAVIVAVAILIGQSPLLLGHDYDFFLQLSRGQIFMTAACYGFVSACWVLLALGYTAAGIAAADLFRDAGAGSSGRTDP